MLFPLALALLSKQPHVRLAATYELREERMGCRAVQIEPTAAWRRGQRGVKNAKSPSPPAPLSPSGRGGIGWIIVGGYSYSKRNTLASSELIDTNGKPQASRFALKEDRNHFGLVTNLNQIVAFGGFSESKDSLDSIEGIGQAKLIKPVELFAWMQLGPIVYVFGGLTAQGLTSTQEAIQVLNLKTGAVRLTSGPLLQSRFGHGAIFLPRLNRVLIVGGKSARKVDPKNPTDYSALNSLEWFDPKKEKCFPAGRMLQQRDRPAVAVTPDGSVAIIGGASNKHMLRSIERFEPATGQTEIVATMKADRMAALTLPYQNGVLIMGGWTDSGEAAEDVEYLNLRTWKVTTVGKCQFCRAEGCLLPLDANRFALVGGKEDPAGRNPHTYETKLVEVFEIE